MEAFIHGADRAHHIMRQTLVTVDVEEVNAKVRAVVEALRGESTAPLSLRSKDAERFFENLQKKEFSQQQTGTCMCCSMAVTSTGSNRLLTHLLSCPLLHAEVKDMFKVVRVHSEGKRKAKQSALVLAAEEQEQAKAAYKEKQRKLVQQGMKASLKAAETEIADKLIAQFFYANALPFNTASSDPTSLYHQVVQAIKATPAGYVPPNAKKIAGPLLDECYDDLWQTIKARDPDGKLVSKFGAAYVSDGWDSVDKRPLINSAFISNNDGGTYWRSVDTTGKTKDAAYLASLMIQDIYAYGCYNVILVISDTCNSMRASWALVQDEFPWILILPCQTHVISLLMRDIAKDAEVKTLIKSEALIVNWFSNHQKPLAILREKVMAAYGKTKELMRSSATRFGSNTLVGKRLLEVKGALQATVVDTDYVAQNYKDLPDEVEESHCGTSVRQRKGGTAKQLVLDDTGFWTDVEVT